jgi:TPR repeat protein
LQLGLLAAQKSDPENNFAEATQLLTAAIAQEPLLLAKSKREDSNKSTRTALGAARILLGGLYYAGLGILKDEAKGAELFHAGVDELVGATQPNLLTGAGTLPVEPDAAMAAIGKSQIRPSVGITVDALTFLYIAGVGGNRDAEFEVGQAYLTGQAVPQDKPEAYRWFQKAADKGSVEASKQLASVYRNGTDGMPRDDAKAFKFAKIAAEGGDAWAEAFSSDLYRLGVGVAANPEQFRFWARKAAEQGVPDAEGNLGYALLVGYGDPSDKVEAMMWMLLAQRSGPSDVLSRNTEINLANALRPDDARRNSRGRTAR